MTTAPLFLPAPRFDWLLPAAVNVPQLPPVNLPAFTLPDFNLLLRQPVVTPVETLAESAELHKDFLEMAYRRWLQTPDQHFRVSQWFTNDGRGPRRLHWHKRVAEKLADHGLLARHTGNNRSRSQYRITQQGIAYVEVVLDRWLTESGYDADHLAKFEAHAAQLLAGTTLFGQWRDEAAPDPTGYRQGKFERFANDLAHRPILNTAPLYILPEPGRSWHFEQAFETAAGERFLHRIHSQGYYSGYDWQRYNSYFYTRPNYDYTESRAYQDFVLNRQAPVEIPF